MLAMLGSVLASGVSSLISGIFGGHKKSNAQVQPKLPMLSLQDFRLNDRFMNQMQSYARPHMSGGGSYRPWSPNLGNSMDINFSGPSFGPFGQVSGHLHLSSQGPLGLLGFNKTPVGQLVNQLLGGLRFA